MQTPFEELEALADCLPEEGESVVVSRREGELVCEAFTPPTFRDGVTDGDLYGRLVLANERLSDLTIAPVWSCILGAITLGAAFFHLSGVGWAGWSVALAIAAVAALAAHTWIAERRRRYFLAFVRPMLDRQAHRLGLARYTLLGAIRQHPELKTLLGEMARERDAE